MNVGERIGDYEIVEILGAGGMGQVYKVRSVLSDRVEAMKVLLPNLGGDTVLADRFLREIKVQATLDHPNIARLNSAQQVGNQLIMLMEYVEGSTLYALLHKGRMELTDVLQCTSQVLDALAYAHAHGVIHRDIKPANIMRTPAGVVKLMDFGIARMHADRQLTRTGMTVGSLYYMPPEQINGGQPDLRSDLYSLGVTLYEMVTGRRPFVGDSDYSIMAAHLQTTPVAPMEIIAGVPLDLNDIIMMAISREPEQRFQSADAFHSALRNFAASIGVTLTELPGARTAPPPPPPGNTKTVVMPPMLPKTVTPAPPSAARPSPSAPATILPATATGISVPAPQRPPAAAAPAPPVFQAAAGPPIPQVQVGAPALPDQAPPSRSGSRRGLYMALGSVATLLVLAAAIIEGPKLMHSGASNAATPVAAPAGAKPDVPASVAQPPAPQPAPPAPVQSTPSPVPPPAVSAPPAANAAPAANVPVQKVVPAQASGAQPRAVPPAVQRPLAPATSAPSPPVSSPPAAQQRPTAQQPPAAQPPPSQQPARPSPAELSELRQQYNQVAIRVGAAKSGLRALQQQMQRQGLDIRGDMLEAESRMDYQMQESMGSMRSGDADSARTSLQMAERTLETIEKFLGR